MMFHGSLYDPCLFDSMFNNYCRCLILNMTSFTNVVGPVSLPCLSQRSRMFDAFPPELPDRREADYFIGSVGFESTESYQMQHWFWSISRFWRNTDSNASRISWFSAWKQLVQELKPIFWSNSPVYCKPFHDALIWTIFDPQLLMADGSSCPSTDQNDHVTS